MPKDADKIVVASYGTVYAAPVGTTAPTNVATALNAAFVDMGYVSDDGVSVTISKNVVEIPAWQTSEPVRRLITRRNFRAQFTLMEWKELTLELATDGVSSGAPSEWTLLPPDNDDIATHAVVIQWEDGARDYRLYMPRVTSTEDVTFNLSRADFAGLPITLEATVDADTDNAWTIFTNDSAFEESTE